MLLIATTVGVVYVPRVEMKELRQLVEELAGDRPHQLHVCENQRIAF